MSRSLRLLIEGEAAIPWSDVSQPLRLGRSSENELVLDEAGISRRHATIHRRSTGELVVEDLGSSNGTLLNGVAVPGLAFLRDGDRLELGGVQIRVEIREEPREGPAKAFRFAPTTESAQRPSIEAPPTGWRSLLAGLGLPRPAANGPVFAPSRDGRSKTPASPRRTAAPATRRLLVVALALAVAAAVTIAIIALGQEEGSESRLPSVIDRGEEVFSLDEIDGDERFGVGPRATIHTAMGASFRWRFVEAEPGTSRITLRYAAADVAPDRLEIQVNGSAVGYAAEAGDAWKEGLELLLPPSSLRSNEENRIDFVDPLHGTEGALPSWTIGQLEIVVQPIPGCRPADCLEEAERLYSLGARSYEGKGLVPRNLFDAWLTLQKAALYLEPLEPKPGVHEKVQGLIGPIRSELDTLCSRLRFTVTRSVALDDYAGARRAAEDILRTFPGDEHPCHEGGRHLLALLDG